MIIKTFSTQTIVYYNQEEAADKLEKSVRSLTKMRNDGKLKWSTQNGEIHFREEVLIAHLDSQERTGKKEQKKKTALRP